MTCRHIGSWHARDPLIKSPQPVDHKSQLFRSTSLSLSSISKPSSFPVLLTFAPLIMAHSASQMFKAHLSLIIDYVGLGSQRALIWEANCSSGSNCINCLLQSDFCRGSSFFDLRRYLRVSCHRTFLSPRFPSHALALWYAFGHWHHFHPLFCFRYLTAPLILGLILVDTVKPQCGWQVLVGKPGDLHIPPPKKGNPPISLIDCKDVAGAWWLNLILT